MLSEYNGLNGKVQFIDKKVTPAHIFQIINVFGKSYKELGFWSKRKGFSVTTDERAANNTSMRSLEKLYWPGGTWTAPRGWTLPTNANPEDWCTHQIKFQTICECGTRSVKKQYCL